MKLCKWGPTGYGDYGWVTATDSDVLREAAQIMRQRVYAITADSFIADTYALDMLKVANHDLEQSKVIADQEEEK